MRLMRAQPRVVVIDDEAPVAEMTAFALSSQGFAVQFAGSGPAGLKLVRDTLPDAVVCDVRMPDLDGEQLVDELRADPRTREIPVLFLSGQCHPSEVTRGDAFMEKPFQLKELAATVSRLIAERDGAH
jgi:CheY-like chemotaxis protein